MAKREEGVWHCGFDPYPGFYPALSNRISQVDVSKRSKLDDVSNKMRVVQEEL